MHALIQDNQITRVGSLPRIWWDGNRWHDLRDDDGTHAAALGWLPVTETTRPDDTATTTHDRAVELVAGVPTVTWTPREWTAEELADRAEQAARLDDHEARLARIEAHLWPPVDPDAELPATVPTMADYAGIWPAGGLLSDGGKVWRNITSVPLTTAPSGFPGAPSQWTHLFVEHAGAIEPEPEPEPGILAWAVGIDAVAGETIVSHAGRLWRCKTSHVTHAGWPPSAATHAVWTPA